MAIISICITRLDLFIYRTYIRIHYNVCNVHSVMLSLSLPVYQVRLDWLPLYYLDLAQPAEQPR